YIMKNVGGSMARESDVVARGAFREALLRPASELQEKMRGEIKPLLDAHAAKTADEMMGGRMLGVPGAAQTATEAVPSGLEDLVASIERGYPGAGTRATRILGTEVGLSERDPNILARGFGRLGEMIKSTPGGEKFSDAWWSIMNSPASPVAIVRKALGIRNPYQKMLNNMAVDSVNIKRHIQDEAMEVAQGSLTDLGEDVHQKALGARAIAESIEKSLGDQAPDTATLLREFVRDPTALVDKLVAAGADTDYVSKLAALRMKPEEVEKIIKFWDEADGMFRKMLDELQPYVDSGVFSKDEIGAWVNYIPKAQNVPSLGRRRAGKVGGPQAPGFMEKTSYTM
ncbi:hypothetical protein LCGC14_3120240, partial [marine sediment metagenome]